MRIAGPEPLVRRWQQARRSRRRELPSRGCCGRVPEPHQETRFRFCGLTSTHHPRRSRFTKRRRMHAMLDGVFKCRNHFFDIRWQFDPTLDDGPHRNRRGLHQGTVQTNGLEIVVKIRSPTTMQRIARSPNARATILPVARSADVRAPFVSEKHVSPAIEALSVSLQSARTPGKGCKVSLVGHDNEHVDVLGVGFGSDDRAQDRYALDTSDLAGRRHESAEPVKERLPVVPLIGIHRRRLNRERESRRAARVPRWTEPRVVFAGSGPGVQA